MYNSTNYLTDDSLDLTGFINDYQSVADECLSKCKNKVHGLE
jgi:hypothetical protein